MKAIARIAHAPASAAARTEAPATVPGWIDTPTAARIAASFAFAQAAADVVVIYGAGGVGKTHTAQHHCAQEPSAWHVIMSPATTGVVPALWEISSALGLPRSNGAAELHRSIVRRVSGTGGLLIVDEAQHLAPLALDQLRSIHDAAGVGLALVGSRDVYARMVGGKSAVELDRLRSRVGRRLQVEASSAEDATAVADECGVTTAPGRRLLIDIAAKAGGLRAVFKALRLATLHANAAGRARTDADLRTAWQELGGA